MAYKILHTSDWHLGKKLFKKDRIEEQKLFLNWLIQYIQREQIDLLIIAGDIFDSPNPPHNAIQLYFDFIQSLGTLEHTQILIIGGNHDSAQFLEAPAKILKRFNTHIISHLKADWREHYFEFSKNNIRVGVSALPYFRNYEIEKWINNNQDLLNQESHIVDVLEKFNQHHAILNKDTNLKIFLSHHIFMGFENSGSEQSISLSGINSIPLQLYAQYDYMALGHIHKHQLIKTEKPTAIYPGSPLPFRFSETLTKYFVQIEVEEDKWDYKKVEIPKWNKLYRLELEQENYQNKIELFLKSLDIDQYEKWVEVKIKLNKPEAGLIDSIRELLWGKKVELLSFVPQLKGQHEFNQTIEKLKDFSFEDLFKEYYLERYGEQEIPPDLLVEFNRLLSLAQNQYEEPQ